MIANTFVIGANHRTWTGTVRDRLFTEPVELPGILAGLQAAGLDQGLWLATCDRVEVIGISADPAEAALAMARLLAGRAGLTLAELAGQVTTLTGSAAVRHVFAVAASLDSQVVGEPQVLGQVKEAYRQAAAAGMAGPELSALMQAAFATAKRIRSETALAERPTSIAAAAVGIARDLHGDLSRRRALLIGQGDMGLLMIEQLQSAGLGGLTITTPVDARAEAAARRLACHYAPFAELESALAGADIVVAAVGLGRYLVRAEMVAAAVRRRRRQPIFIIDAALPADVEPAAGDIDAAFVYDLADLERVALSGRVSRQAAAEAAWALLDQAVAAFARDRAERSAVPMVAALRRQFEVARQQILTEAAELDATEATRRLVNRLLHAPSEALRRLAAETDGVAEAERLLALLFRLEQGEVGDDAQGRDRSRDQEHDT